jgi:hypothetical protein
MVSILDPQNLKYILPGDVLVLGIIVVMIIMFFKYRVPSVQKRIDLKVDLVDCVTKQHLCNELVMSKLNAMHEKQEERYNVTTAAIMENRKMVMDKFDEVTRFMGYVTRALENGIAKHRETGGKE